MVPFRLTPHFVERIWGRDDLAPWFRATNGKIGEVWYHTQGLAHDEAFLGADAFAHERDCCSLLVKFLFTTERLSVQVHPGDKYAREREQSAGKTEMWHILEAEPGASIALGFREQITAEKMREAALDGSIEELLHWRPVIAGQSIFLQPGVVHAIGPGITLCEIQQYSDLTYRIYDYGRDRELHLEKSLEVSLLQPFDAPQFPERSPIGEELLGASDHFIVDRLQLSEPFRYQPERGRFHLLIVTQGTGAIANQRFSAGEAWMIPANSSPFEVDPVGPVSLVRAYHS